MFTSPYGTQGSQSTISRVLSAPCNTVKLVWVAMNANVEVMGSRKVILASGSLVNSDNGGNEEGKDDDGEIDNDTKE